MMLGLNLRRLQMPKFIVDVELDGYDTEEEMLEHCTEGAVYEALENHSFTVNSVKEISDD